MKVVISLGGSILSPEDVNFIQDVSSLLKKASNDMTLYIVTGGGKFARIYINAARNFTHTEKRLDKIGILATKMNALLLATALDFPYQKSATINKDVNAKTSLVMGGTTPGQSTDAVGATLALRVKADKFIIATNVNGVYTDDPKTHPEAKKYDSIHIDKLLKLCNKKWQAGLNVIIDKKACKIIKKGNIKTKVLNGKDLKSLKNALYDKKFDGTIIEV
jgi:uridylate kinase